MRAANLPLPLSHGRQNLVFVGQAWGSGSPNLSEFVRICPNLPEFATNLPPNLPNAFGFYGTVVVYVRVVLCCVVLCCVVKRSVML